MSGKLLQVNVNVVKQLKLSDIGLSSAQIRRINRKATNDYIKVLNKFIPTDISAKNNIGVTGYRKHRIKRRRANARQKNPSASFWVGENDVLAQFKKGAWRDSRKGASKGSFFQRDAFVIRLKSGTKMMLFRDKSGKIKPVRAPLVGYSASVDKGVDMARDSVLSSFRRDLKLELAKKK